MRRPRRLPRCEAQATMFQLQRAFADGLEGVDAITETTRRDARTCSWCADLELLSRLQWLSPPADRRLELARDVAPLGVRRVARVARCRR